MTLDEKPPTVARPIRWLQRMRDESDADAPDFEAARFSPSLQTQVLVLQPTPFCNIRCDYCYLPARDHRERMPLSVVEAAVRRLRADGLVGSSLSIVWHAGEPLVAPPTFYDDAFAACETVLGDRCTVTHAIQTNGTLITAEWCELFLRHRVRVGVSVDGPRFLHDRHRRTRDGKGTHARVERGIALLRRFGVPFHAIAVATADSLPHAEAMTRYFGEIGVTAWGCSFDEAEGDYRVSSLRAHETRHAGFLRELADHALQGPGHVALREMEVALQLVASGLPVVRFDGVEWPFNPQTLPFAFVNVAHDGSFGTFSPELLGQRDARFGDFALGNVLEGGYLESTRTRRFRKLWSEIMRGVRLCRRSCAHFDYCGGGSPVNKLYENGSFASGETHYCRSALKTPFDLAMTHFERGLGGSAILPDPRHLEEAP